MTEKTFTYASLAEKATIEAREHALGFAKIHDNHAPQATTGNMVFSDVESIPTKRQLTQRDFLDELAEERGVSLI